MLLEITVVLIRIVIVAAAVEQPMQVAAVGGANFAAKTGERLEG